MLLGSILVLKNGFMVRREVIENDAGLVFRWVVLNPDFELYWICHEYEEAYKVAKRGYYIGSTKEIHG